MSDKENWDKNERYLKENGFRFDYNTESWLKDWVIDGQKWHTTIPNEYLCDYPHENFVRLVDNAVKKRKADPGRI